MNKYQEISARYKGLSTRTVKLQERIQEISEDVLKVENGMHVLFSFNEWINDTLKTQLENITNMALKSIFPEKELSFRVMANRNKQGVFYDLYIETNNTLTRLLDAKGGGVLDVIQMCLRLTYLIRMKGKLRQFLLLDEPFKNLDGERVNLAIDWLCKITKEFDIQLLIVTHIPSLIFTVEDSGNIEVRYVDGKSEVYQ